MMRDELRFLSWMDTLSETYYDIAKRISELSAPQALATLAVMVRQETDAREEQDRRHREELYRTQKEMELISKRLLDLEHAIDPFRKLAASYAGWFVGGGASILTAVVNGWIHV